MLEILQYSFAQRAVIGGIIIALVCAFLGTFLVLRRLSLLGDGIAHLAFGGIAIGLLLGIPPIAAAFVVAILGSLWIQRAITKFSVYGEAAVAVIISLGMGVAIIIIGAVKGFTVNLFTYLFGSILTLSNADIYSMLVIGGIVIIFIIAYYRQLVLYTFNEELALLSGVRTNTLTTALSILTAATIVVTIRAVGILLVSALLVLPALIALQISKSFKQTIVIACIASLVATILGLIIAFEYDVPVGATIVVVLSVLFFATLSLKNITPLRNK